MGARVTSAVAVAGMSVVVSVAVVRTLVAAAVAVAGTAGLALGTAEGVRAARPQAASSVEATITAASLFIATILYHKERCDAKI